MTAATSERLRARLRVIRWVALGLLVLWAGFWTLFAGAHLLGEGWGAFPYVLRFVLPVLALLFAAWRWPRPGGVGLVVAGIGAAFYFEQWGTRLLLSLPMVLLGAVIAWAGPAEAGRAPPPPSGDAD
ncbi:MAG: hypothetical protein ACYTG6_18120 [Planctomycetota bacterium]